MTILLESGRLLLRRPETDDLPSLERVFCDPDMMRYLGAPWTPEYVAEVCAEWRADWGIERRWSGVLVKKDTLEMIGTAGLTHDTIPGESLKNLVAFAWGNGAIIMTTCPALTPRCCGSLRQAPWQQQAFMQHEKVDTIQAIVAHIPPRRGRRLPGRHAHR